MSLVSIKHQKEWLDSAVSSEIINLNVVSLSEFEPYDRLLYALPLSDRRNDGRIRDKLLKRYAHIENGGWWISGVDILTGDDSQWGQFKPDTSYSYQERVSQGFDPKSPVKNKLIKYETPPKVSTKIIALKVSFFQTWKIIRRQDEKAKNAWIERIQRFWQTASQNLCKSQLPCSRTANLNNRVFQSRTGQASTVDRRKNEIQSISTQCLEEFQAACAIKEYDKIDRILQSVSDRSIDNPKQFRGIDPGGIERLIKTEDRGFWSWLVETPEIPVILAEGGKKAGALITANYVAIALPGIFNGYRQPKDEWGRKMGSSYLIPQLEVLAQQGREIIFCFDNDTKLSTVKNVRKAIVKTGTLLENRGAIVSIISWDSPEKGVDDLIVARGVEYFHSLYKARTSLSNFKLSTLLDISKYQPLIVNQRYLSENLIPPEHAQLIGIKSPKNTGKTEWLSRIVRRLLFQGKPVLIITHRIQLAKALCARFGVDHIEEVKNSETKGILGYGLCIDSLHSNSQARFNPEDWSEAIVILDECEQVIWHLLNSSTCQLNRVAIIENFQQLLKTVIGTGGKIYLSDADLSCIAIDYVQKLIAIPVKTWVVDNIYNKSEATPFFAKGKVGERVECPSTQKRLLLNYSGGDPRELIAALVKAIERGEKALVHTTGQKAKSRWGSINLESYLGQKFPHVKILRIDGESVSDPKHPAYGCMPNLNVILSNYDITIASPVIETGISIDLKGHFDSVWAIAQGVQTVDAVCQTLERLRDNVPRHIWAKTTAKGNRIGNGSTSIKYLLASEHKVASANIRLLQLSGIRDLDEFDVDFSVESLTTWAKRACIVNAGKNNYRSEIINKLLLSGYELTSVSDENKYESQIIKAQIKATATKNYQKYCQTIPNMPSPSDLELEELNKKKAKTIEERYRERKGNLSNRYGGIEVTPELVEKDDSGWYQKLQLHYYLTIGNAYLSKREQKSLAKIEEQGKGRGFKPDINKKQLYAKVKALQLINIEQFFDAEAEFSQENLASWLDLVIEFRFDLQTILGVTVNPEDDTAIAVAQRFLKKLGLKLEFKYWRGTRQNKQRIYSGCNIEDNRHTIFQQWQKNQSL